MGSTTIRARPTRALALVTVPMLLVLLALPALAQIAPAGDAADEEGRPAIWEGRAAASGLQIALNSDPRVIPLDDLIRFDVPEGDSRWDSSGLAEARVSSVYPGAAGTGGLNLMCQEFFPCPDGFPPDYPLSVVAAHPIRPEVETQDGLGRAEASRERVRTDAAVTRFDGLEALEHALTVEAVEARTLQRFDDEGALIVRSLSRVSGLELGGGVIRIDEVLASSVVRMDGDAVQEIDSTVRVTGVTVADQPAELTDEGIVITGQGDDRRLLDGAQEALDAFSDATDLQMALVGAEEGADETSAVGRALGLTISMRVPVSGPDLPNPFPPEFPLPPNSIYRDYVLDATVARAVSQARVDDFELGDLADLVGDTGDVPAPAFESGAAELAPPGGAAVPFEPSAAPGEDAAAPESATAEDEAAGQDLAFELLGGEAADAVVKLYLALGLAAAALVGASRIGSAPRLMRR